MISAYDRILRRTHQEDECLVFDGLLVKGYGHVSSCRLDPRCAGVQSAHRIVWITEVGPIPDGHDLHHDCPRRNCVNVTHMICAPHAVHPAIEKVGRTHCRKGHPYDEENTYITSGGNRQCRRCHAISERDRQRRLRALSSSR